MSELSRRTLVAGAVTLPALTAVAGAQPAAVAASPISGAALEPASEISALADRCIELHQAHGEAISAFTPYEEKEFDWRAKNPVPMGDVLEQKEWLRRLRKFARETPGHREAKAAMNRAGSASTDALRTLIETPPKNLAELLVKAKAMMVVDPSEGFNWGLVGEFIKLMETAA